MLMRAWMWMVAALFVGLVGCGSSGGGSGSKKCTVEGEQESCTCPDGTKSNRTCENKKLTACACATVTPPGSDATSSEDVTVTTDDAPVTGEDTPVTGEDTPVTGEDTPVVPPDAHGDATNPPPGACSNPSDKGMLQSAGSEIIDIAQGCAFECSGDAGCSGNCVSSSASLSQTCGACFGDLIGCVFKGCISSCASGFENPSCTSCAAEMGCIGGFEKCSGEKLPVGTTCTPTCGGKQCGDDGCGGSCGSCASGKTCNQFGMCQSGTCVPNCADKQCGDDGCGGKCGTCSGGATCVGFSCVGGCTPFCGEKQCGDDGCDGSCGTCTGGKTCNTFGQCVSGGCVPKCSGKQCGDDGCDGQCGFCGSGETCQAGACTPASTDCGNVTYEGCCDGDTLKYCEGGTLKAGSCASQPSCGWDTGGGYYNCGTPGGADPSGANPKACK